MAGVLITDPRNLKIGQLHRREEVSGDGQGSRQGAVAEHAATPELEHRPHVPGPVHRGTFFEEQRRNRRAAWKPSAASIGAVFAMGVAVSAVLSPLLYALALIVLDIVNILLPLPDARPAVAAFGDRARSVCDCA